MRCTSGHVRGWRDCESGNVSILLALCLVVLMMIAGAAIDGARYSNARTELASATDATVLAALSAALQADKAGKISAQSIGQEAGIAMWKANVGPWLEDGVSQPVIKIAKKGNQWTASVDFNGSYPTRMINIIGISSMALASHAQASTAVGTQKNFWEFSVAVDTSNSMGIGATPADMAAISTKVEKAFSGCTFACHFTGTDKYFTDTFTKAHNLGIKLRLDVVNDAVSAMVGQMQAIDDGSHMKARLLGLDRDANELVAMTPTLSKIIDYKIALTNAVVIPNAATATGDSDYGTSLATLSASVGAAGDGSSASKPRKAVFIVTDGVHDSYYDEPNAVYDWTSHHHLGALDPKSCKTMKDNGTVIGVLYIDYIPPTGMEYLISSFKDNILPNLQACASDGMFYNATSASDIKTAMSQMLTDALSSTSPRLTQ